MHMKQIDKRAAHAFSAEIKHLHCGWVDVDEQWVESYFNLIVCYDGPKIYILECQHIILGF